MASVQRRRRARLDILDYTSSGISTPRPQFRMRSAHFSSRSLWPHQATSRSASRSESRRANPSMVRRMATAYRGARDASRVVAATRAIESLHVALRVPVVQGPAHTITGCCLRPAVALILPTLAHALSRAVRCGAMQPSSLIPSHVAKDRFRTDEPSNKSPRLAPRASFSSRHRSYLLTAILACRSVGRTIGNGGLVTTSLTQRASPSLK